MGHDIKKNEVHYRMLGGKFLVMIFTCGVQLEGLCWGEEPRLIGLPALGVPFIGVVGFEPPAQPPADPTPSSVVRLPVGMKQELFNISCFLFIASNMQHFSFFMVGWAFSSERLLCLKYTI
jgi:hypothetical protein